MGSVNLPGVKRDIGLMVQSLARNIHDHERSESSVPKTIRFMLSDFPSNGEGIKYNWQCFIVPDTGEEVRPSSFLQFVTENPPRGLGSTIGKLELWVRAELPELLPMLKDSKIPELAGHGGERKEGQVGNTNLKSSNNDSDYITARLKRDNPELAGQVIRGEISAHEAALRSGIRKKYLQVRWDPDGIIGAIEKKFSADEIRQIMQKLEQKFGSSR